jgi:hypothetical protein
MTDVRFVFDRDSNRGKSGDNTHQLGRPTNVGIEEKILSISYPILSSSVSAALKTDVFTLDIGTGTEIITIRRSLPDTDELVSLFNQGIVEAFVGTSDLPQMVGRASGYFIENPGATTATFVFPSSNIQVLYFGEVFTEGSEVIAISAGSSFGPFEPSSRLGANHIEFRIEQGLPGGIKLPISGEYREGALFYPPANFIVKLSSTSTIASLTTLYPAIDVKQQERADLKSEVVMTVDS